MERINNMYRVEQDIKGRCVVSLFTKVRRWSDDPNDEIYDEYWEPVALIYKTKGGSIYRDDWEKNAQIICDALNTAENLVKGK